MRHEASSLRYYLAGQTGTAFAWSNLAIFAKSLSKNTPFDSVISLLGIYPKEIIRYVHRLF